jgi:thioredoxin-like negative regulator of GroEL
MEPLDRKTFYFGLLVAVVAVLVGVYFLTQNNSVATVAPPPRAAPREPPLAPSPYITDVQNDDDAVSEMKTGPKVVLLHTPWCGHCRNMMPSFVDAATSGAGVKWSRIDGNIAPSVVKRGDVVGFPTVFGITADGVVKQMTGARDAPSLLQFAESLRAPTPSTEPPTDSKDETV